MQRRDDLSQSEVRLLTDKGEDLFRMLLQWRSTPSTRHRLGSPVLPKAQHPSDRGTDADVVLFSRLTSGRSSLHELDNSDSQLTRIRCAHRAQPHIRYRDDSDTVRYVHSLNNTALALPRILCQLVENNQCPDGSISVPEVLQGAMGKDVITRHISASSEALRRPI